MHWHLLLEEYGPELIYLIGEHNIVADGLSRLEKEHFFVAEALSTLEQDSKGTLTLDNYAQVCALTAEDLPKDAFPLKYSTIHKAQFTDKKLKEQCQCLASFHMKSFHGGDKTYDLICQDEKIYIPNSLQTRIVEWYHEQLCHPGINRTEETIRQHFTWKNLRQTVKDICSKCHVCQCCKKDTKNIA